MRPVLVCLSFLCAFVVSGQGGPVDFGHGTLSVFPLRTAPTTLPAISRLNSGAPRALSTAVAPTSSINSAALQEMLQNSTGQSQRWNRAPALTVLVSVMEYHIGEPATYVATSEQLTEHEISMLAGDLTTALALLTGNTYTEFAAIRREAVPAGASISVLRPGQIVAGRYRHVQKLVHTIGFGGRAARLDGTITGAAIMLDSEYDRTSQKRRLLRTHELGHALGYNHVLSSVSIMNPSIGPEPTDFDREAATIAFPSPSPARLD